MDGSLALDSLKARAPPHPLRRSDFDPPPRVHVNICKLKGSATALFHNWRAAFLLLSAPKEAIPWNPGRRLCRTETVREPPNTHRRWRRASHTPAYRLSMAVEHPVPGYLRATQAASIALLTTASGLNLGLSFFVVPRLLESPTPLMLQQWARMYRTCSISLPPASPAALVRALLNPAGPVTGFALPALLNIYLACRLPPGSPPRRIAACAVAAALVLSSWPFSFVLMGPIQRRLLKKASDVETLGPEIVLLQEEEEQAKEKIGVKEAETGHALIDTWALYNLYQGGTALVAGCLGLYAALS